MEAIVKIFGHIGEVLDFISGLGLGAVLGAFVVIYVKRRYELADRNFREMREAYSGLLRTITEQPARDEDIAAAHGAFRYWAARVMLACPDASQDTFSRLYFEGRAAAHVRREGIILVMRNDLRQSN